MSEIITVELRSDTFTKPSKPMLEAMCAAEVGDSVYNEDPTVLSKYLSFF
jgi:threonine aldolase